MDLCPIKINAGVLLVRRESTPYTGETLTAADAIRGSVEISVEATEVERTIATPSGGGLPPLVTGRRTTMTITQELYAPGSLTAPSAATWESWALFGAAGLQIVPSALGQPMFIRPQQSVCVGAGIWPVTAEFRETNGNTYRLTGGTATLAISSDPGGLVQLVWTLTGSYERPVDATPVVVSLKTSLPIRYAGAEITVTPADSDIDPYAPATCPAFSFDPGLASEAIPSACTPDGGGYSLPLQGSSVLTLTGTAAARESVTPWWLVQDETTAAVSVVVGRRDDVEFSIEQEYAGIQVERSTAGQMIAYNITSTGSAGGANNRQFQLVFKDIS